MNGAPGSKVPGANMEPTWALSAPDGPHVAPRNLAIRGWYTFFCYVSLVQWMGLVLITCHHAAPAVTARDIRYFCL